MKMRPVNERENDTNVRLECNGIRNNAQPFGESPLLSTIITVIQIFQYVNILIRTMITLLSHESYLQISTKLI